MRAEPVNRDSTRLRAGQAVSELGTLSLFGTATRR
jgi:hypothetical protein